MSGGGVSSGIFVRSAAEAQLLERLCDFVQQGRHTEARALWPGEIRTGPDRGPIRIRDPNPWKPTGKTDLVIEKKDG